MMEDENKAMQMVEAGEEVELIRRSLMRRRDFLKSLKKWSQAVIGGIVLGGLMPASEASAWVNSRGSWVNGGGGGWANRSASWVNGGGGWHNSGTNWVNRGGTWINGGGGWVNRGGSGWVNNRGGSGWINNRGW